MGEISGCSSVAVIGAGAAGTLVAAQLATQATARRSRGGGQPHLHIILIDPTPGVGHGVAYSTRDPRHRLNVSAGRISAWPDREDDFLQWLAEHHPEYAQPATYAPRMLYGAYLRDVPAESLTVTSCWSAPA